MVGTEGGECNKNIIYEGIKELAKIFFKGTLEREIFSILT